MEVQRGERFARYEASLEALVDVLCWAAREGVETPAAAKYPRLRANLLSAHQEVRPDMVAAQLHHQVRDLDAFATIVSAESIEDVIYAEDAIDIIMNSRAAIYAYDCYLQASGTVAS